MNRTALLIVIAASTLVGAAEQVAQPPIRDPNLKRELQRLQGGFRFEQLVENGEQVGAEELKDRTIFFGGEAFLVKRGQQLLEVGTQKLDPTKKLKTINAMIAQGPKKGDVLLGIYELEADTMKVCFDTTAERRPTEFKSEAGSGLILAIYKRMKSTPQDQFDITGDYVSESTEVDGTKHTAEVSIEKLGDAYRITYMKNGMIAYIGTGIRKGNELSVCWASQGQAGIAVYEIQQGAKLVGQYTTWGASG